MQPLTGIWLGRRSYPPVFELQNQLFELRKAERIGDVVLFLEHEPTITLGRGAHASHLLANRAKLDEFGVELVETDRGGDITLHAPGQLVAYPIVALEPGRRDVRRYVKILVETMRLLVTAHGIDAGPFERYIGLWADAAHPEHWEAESVGVPVKLGAVGVRISRWTTMHGFALNLTTDLELFRLIVPCGIRDLGVSSVAALTDDRPDTRTTARQAHGELARLLDSRPGHYIDATRDCASDNRLLQRLRDSHTRRRSVAASQPDA